MAYSQSRDSATTDLAAVVTACLAFVFQVKQADIKKDSLQKSTQKARRKKRL